MKEKVLLIQPNYQIRKDAQHWACSPPLGILYLAAVLEKKHIPVEIVDATLKNLSIKRTVSIIKKSKAKYVGFSIMTPSVDWCIEVAKHLPKTIIKIAGGPHVSALPEDFLKSGFDISVIGEGEETLTEIVQGKRLETIKSIVFKKNKKIFYTPQRPPVDLNTLPFPARHLIERGGTDKPYFAVGTRYFPWGQILSSRGCPFNCYFCVKNVFGFKFRARTPENVLSEIDFLVKTYKVKEIDFYDDCFNFDIKRAEKIMDLIIERGYKLYIRFNIGLRADKITKKLLQKMKKAGVDFVAFGIESGNQRILDLIPKGENLKDITKAVNLTHQAGIPVTGFFILGLIGDTKETMQDTINFATNLPFDRAIFNIAIPNPGTRMSHMILQNGGEIFKTPWKDFNSLSGKMNYTLPGMATPSEVENMYHKAYFKFYFRPSYIIQHIPQFFSLSQMIVMIRGFKKIIYMQRSN